MRMRDKFVQLSQISNRPVPATIQTFSSNYPESMPAHARDKAIGSVSLSVSTNSSMMVESCAKLISGQLRRISIKLIIIYSAC